MHERILRVNDWYTPFDTDFLPRPMERQVDTVLEQHALQRALVAHQRWKRYDLFDPNNTFYIGNERGLSPQILLEQIAIHDTQRSRGTWILPYDRWMATANTGPFGIYNQPGTIGKEEKGALFETSSEVTPEVLASALAFRAIKTYERLQVEGVVFNRDNPFTIVYIGDGNGTTRVHTSEIIRREKPDLFAILRNVSVDIGATFHQKQKENRVKGVVEEFFRDSAINMLHLPDKSVYGVVYAYELLDDLPAKSISASNSGDTLEHVLTWSDEGLTQGRVYKARINIPDCPEKILFHAFHYQDLGYPDGLPVSLNIVMALAEIDRVMAAGTVLFGDYALSFTTEKDKIKADNLPIRVYTNFDRRATEEVDILADLGKYNVTADVDPFLIKRMAEKFGWRTFYVGYYGPYAARFIPDWNEEKIKEMMISYHTAVGPYGELHRSKEIQELFKQWVRWRLGENPGFVISDELRKYLALREQLMRFSFADLQMWAMDFDVPLVREGKIVDNPLRRSNLA